MYVKINKIKFGKDKLVPMIVQEANSGVVLCLFYANWDSIRKTQETGMLWRFSRSNNRVMMKGETSGNTLRVISIKPDCDSDALLVKVKASGPVCHTGSSSCFGNWKPERRGTCDILDELSLVIADRKRNPSTQSYTSKIVIDRNTIEEKLNEELKELLTAESRNDIAWEAADLLYFLLVYLENRGVSLNDVIAELSRRRKQTKKAK